MHQALCRLANAVAALALATSAVTASAAITEAEARRALQVFQDTFTPIVTGHGARLFTDLDYMFTTPGAMATRSMDQKRWFIKITGGVALFGSTTADTFTLILCHEMGHHLGGYPFFSHEQSEWAAAEGQADYWATQACAKKLWRNETEVNAGFADLKETGCDTLHEDANETNLCKRIYHAVDIIADFEGKTSQGGMPSIKRRDTSVVKELFVSHPKAQCRVDSAHMGLRCPREFDFTTIPGRGNPLGQNTISSENEARRSSCFTSDGFTAGTRPLCWFKAATLEKTPDPKPTSATDTYMSERIDMDDGLLPWILN
jgi:hypothetical protein